MDVHGQDERARAAAQSAPVDLVARARVLLPRSMGGEDVRGEIRALFEQAQAGHDLDAECAVRFVEVVDNLTRGDTEALRSTASELIDRARSAGLPLWESRGLHFLARVHLGEGEEVRGIEELVTAEVLTSEQIEPSLDLAGAINGVAVTYLLLDLFEDSARLFERIEEILAALDDPWGEHVLRSNRLLNVATWAVALERVGRGDEVKQRLEHALQRAAVTDIPTTGETIDADAELVIIFAQLMLGLLSAEQGRVRIGELTADGHPREGESFAHFGVAVRLIEQDRLVEAHEAIQTGLDHVRPIRGDGRQIRDALEWLRSRVAVLQDPHHPGLQQGWDYAQRMTEQVWDLRLRRRETVLDRLHIRRLQHDHDLVEQASLEDPLTGTANRRRIDRERAELLDSVQQGWMTVIYLDADDLKTINDTFGHDLGDEVLRHLADVLRASVRTHDLVGRYGGDEFVVIAHQCDPDDAAILGERIVTAVRTHPWHQLHPALVVTASAGVAVTDGAYDHLFTAADQALYTAKDTGRDQAVIRTLQGQDRQALTSADRSRVAQNARAS